MRVILIGISMAAHERIMQPTLGHRNRSIGLAAGVAIAIWGVGAVDGVVVVKTTHGVRAVLLAIEAHIRESLSHSKYV